MDFSTLAGCRRFGYKRGLTPSGSRALAVSQYLVWLPPLATLLALAALGVSLRGRRPADFHIYGAVFIAGISFFFLRNLTGLRTGIVSDLIAIASNATCGWSWLLSRALFRRPGGPSSRWPLAMVLAQVVAGAVLQFSANDSDPVMRMVDNGLILISSTVLLLAIAEPLRGLQRDQTAGEQRFRVAYAVAQATLVTISMVVVGGMAGQALGGQIGGIVRVACATTALLGGGLAIWYRSGHPLLQRGRVRRPAAAGEAGLAQRILGQMTEQAAYADAGLKVADLARRVAEAEYKVTQCITGTLGFRNFNHMVNHFRLEEAKLRLGDAQLDLPVLTIALDCGFGSIGPFNRAFKAETGMTPTRFREVSRKGTVAGLAA